MSKKRAKEPKLKDKLKQLLECKKDISFLNNANNLIPTIPDNNLPTHIKIN